MWIIDNQQANFTGSWVTGTSSTDKYGADYRYKSRATTGFYGDFIPSILTAGNYKVYETHPQGNNRTTDAPHTIHYNGGSQTVYVNQTVGGGVAGGTFNLLGTFNFAAGTAGYVRITDGFTSGIAGQTATNVMADAIKFVYVPPIIAPAVTASGTAPLSYQWMLDGSNIFAANTNTYTRTNVQTNDAGGYSVLVGNIAGSVTSAVATLTVTVPRPARFQFITRLPDRRARFIITGEPGATYTIQDSSNLTTTNWSALMTVVNTNGTLDLIDDSASNAATRFYRTKQ